MGHGSPLCAKLQERTVSQFKGLSPSTFHNIVKRFRESRCVKAKVRNRCWMLVTIEPSGGIVWETVMLPWWIAASRNATWNCIMQKGRHFFILRRNISKFSGPEVIWDGPKDSGNVFSGQTSPHFSLFLEKQTSDSTCQSLNRLSRLLPMKSAETIFCDGMGVRQSPQHGWSAYMWRYHWCKGLCWNFG